MYIADPYLPILNFGSFDLCAIFRKIIVEFSMPSVVRKRINFLSAMIVDSLPVEYFYTSDNEIYITPANMKHMLIYGQKRRETLCRKIK